MKRLLKCGWLVKIDEVQCVEGRMANRLMYSHMMGGSSVSFNYSCVESLIKRRPSIEMLQGMVD